MQYKVGDIVTIRNDLSTDHTDVLADMLKYAGREAIIKRLEPHSAYGDAVSLKGIPYSWYPDTFDASEELVWEI